MSEPLFVFIALAGSAILGFLFAFSLNRRQRQQFLNEKAASELEVKEMESLIAKLQTECETRMMAIENIRKISQDVENQSIEKSEELKTLRSENARLQEEIKLMKENPIEVVREIDVIREVPVLLVREISLPETRNDKAKKLMKAFTKGYLEENSELQSAITSQLAEDNLLD